MTHGKAQLLNPRLTAMNRLSVADRSNGESALLRFEFREPGAAGSWPLGLPWLGGALAREIWQADGDPVEGQSDGIFWRQVGDLLAVRLVVDDPPDSDPEARVAAAYRQLIACIRTLGCPHLVRAWNYMPAINQGEGDAERYRRFCSGRAQALDEMKVEIPALSACTAIGTDEPRLRIYLLTARSPALHIENPRQVSAYRYPRRYGPRSPSFARATAVPGAADQTLLLISGTASVVGHETRHVGDVVAQAGEIVANIETLLEHSAEQIGRPARFSFDRHSLIRVYVRDPADWPRVEARFREAWPDVRLAAFRGDICRSDLLVEIEAVTGG
jgi:chorismate lyase/3-hydroxybenzoate synthase